MKITASGGGGFAGIGERYEVDTQTSPAGPALEAALDAHGRGRRPPALRRIHRKHPFSLARCAESATLCGLKTGLWREFAYMYCV